MTVKGLLVYRLVCAASLIVTGIVLLIDTISAVQASGGGSLSTLWELGLAVLAFSLSARSLGSRIEILSTEVRLHSTWRTLRLDLRQIEGVDHGRFFGWDVLHLGLAGGRSVRLPLLTQPGDPRRLQELEEVLTSALAKRHGQSPTTPT